MTCPWKRILSWEKRTLKNVWLHKYLGGRITKLMNCSIILLLHKSYRHSPSWNELSLQLEWSLFLQSPPCSQLKGCYKTSIQRPNRYLWSRSYECPIPVRNSSNLGNGRYKIFKEVNYLKRIPKNQNAVPDLNGIYGMSTK